MRVAPVDLDGQTRAVNDPATADTGFGPVTYVDKGAYEFQAGPCLSPIEGDVNCDGVVDLFDFIRMAANWLETI